MKKKVKIYGGLIKDKDTWVYYFGGNKKSLAYGPNIPNRQYAEKILNDHLQQAKEQFGDDYEVEFIREDKLD